MDHLEKIFLELDRMNEWKIKEYKTFSLHPRSYENYLRLEEQLKHILHFFNLTIDIELLNIDGCYIQMLVLSSENDMNYLLRVNEEEFMTYIDGKTYMLTIPDKLTLDSCQITYDGDEDILVSVTSVKDADDEKIGIKLYLIEDDVISLLVPWDKKYSRFAAGSTQKGKMTELYLYDDDDVKLKYYSKEEEHVVDISLVLGYLVNTNQLHSATYKYTDTKYPAYNIDEKYAANVKEKATMLMNSLKNDVYIKKFMAQLNTKLEIADQKLYEMICREYPIIEEFSKQQKEEKVKTLKYIN